MRSYGRPQPGPAVEEAVEWFVRRDAGALSAAEQAAFDAWLAADPAHRAALAEVERIWSDFDGVPTDWVAQDRVRDTGDHEPAGVAEREPPPPRRRPWRRGIGGAAIAGVCMLLALWLDVPIRLQADAFSGVGEVRTVALPDGSTAVLNTHSAIAIDYATTERRIRLLRGEAEFTVAEDADRPFRVETERGVSTALGTVFLVRRVDDRTTVTVLESRVSVAFGNDGGSSQTAVLANNQQVSYDVEHGLGPVMDVDPLVAGAWRRGKLIFVDRTMGDVIDELNRYHLGEILIADDALRSTRVSGVFDIHDPVAVVDALEMSLALRSTRLSDLLIVIHR